MDRLATFRLSLLVSLGLAPVACGGTTRGAGSEASEGGEHTASGGATAGAVAAGSGGGAAVSGSAGTFPVIGGIGHPPTCTSPTTEPNSGLISCDETYQHRPKAVSCTLPTSAADAAAGGSPALPAALPRADGERCSQDSDCAAFQYGYCPFVLSGEARICRSGCLTDQDCGAGRICICEQEPSAHGGACRQSDCVSDDDCGNGYRCATAALAICGLEIGFACQSAIDECVGYSCGGTSGCLLNDQVGSNAHRVCGPSLVCGRPFLVAAEARVAPVVNDGAWAAYARRPRLDHLTATERAALAQHWTKMGQLEHASIAAFARFSLQLLSLSAPPELVEACSQALADETAHTKLCFALASAYAGRALGPGPLNVAGSLALTSLEDIVDLVILEGCYGETSAALDALAAADTATDPVIAAAYSLIARDEQRHAELAFRFVRWALERDGGLATRIEATLSAESWQPVAREVVEPCLRALLRRQLAA